MNDEQVVTKPLIVGNPGRHQLETDQVFLTKGTNILCLPAESKLDILNNEDKDLTVVDSEGNFVCTVPSLSRIVLKARHIFRIDLK